MKTLFGLISLFPFYACAQTVELQPVDIIYGNQLIHSHHQVVLSSPDDVTIIPAQKKTVAEELGPNVVISASGERLSYLEENQIAKNEKAIYDEVNKRTEEAPFTVLFTGNIPEEIQEKRLRMMPEIGIFGDQLKKIETDEQENSSSHQKVSPDTGEFSAISPDLPTSTAKNKTTDVVPAEKKKLTDEDRLEQLIGGG